MYKWLEKEGWKNKGGYFLISKDGEITHSNSYPENQLIIDKQYLVDFYFQVGVDLLKHFAKTEANKEVYAVAFELTSEHMLPAMYINTMSGLAETNAYYQEYYRRKNESYSEKDALTTTYSTGDFSYIYDGRASDDFDYPKEVDILSNIYDAITWGDGLPCKVPQDIAFKNEFFMDLTEVGLEVAAKLEEASIFLDKTDDCIFFYCDHDEDFFYNKEYEKKYKAIYPWLFE